MTVRSFALAIIATTDDVGRGTRGTHGLKGMRWERSAVGCIATHALLLSESSKTGLVAFLFSFYRVLIGATLLLLLEGGEVLAALAFNKRVLGINIKRAWLLADESIR